MRPVNMAIALASVVLSAWLNLNLWSPQIWLSGFALALLVAAGNIHNDMVDLAIDQINRPERPLPAQTISLRHAGIFAALLTLISLGIGIFQDLAKLDIHLSWTLLYSLIALTLWFYNTRLKGTVLWGNFTVAALCGVALLLPQNYNPHPWRFDIAWTLAIFAFLINLSREIVKDLEDQEGDARVGIKTLPLVHGSQMAQKLVRGLLIATIALLSITGALKIWSFWFLILALPLTVLPLLLAWPLHPLAKAQGFIKYAMLGGLFAAVFAQVLS